MKVNGTPAGTPSIDAEAFKAPQTEKASGSNTLEAGAAKGVDSDVAVHDAGLAAGAQGSRRAEMNHLVADIAAELKAGQIGTDAAVDKLVQRILDRQVDAAASPALRSQIESALRNTLQNDPFVSAQVNTLRRRQD
jgi:hypothetical protein